MAHCIVPEAEAILDKEFPVLDKGFVRLVDYMGGDARIVQAARVSYGAGTKSFREDSALIDNLLRQEHTSPIEQVILTFHVKLPIFVARQWIRHRTARVNEVSGRYSVMKDEFYVPAAETIAPQNPDNKQGRAAEALPEEEAAGYIVRMESAQKRAYGEYAELIEAGLARELARIDLPLSLYTEWYWQIDLHNLFRFIQLRIDQHAQFEIREYARVILDITRAVAPAACASFENHVLGGTRFSAEEMAELKRRLSADGPGAGADPRQASPKGDAALLSGKPLMRFEEKLRTGRQL
jgi:thymidylate synthase (FAD)